MDVLKRCVNRFVNSLRWRAYFDVHPAPDDTTNNNNTWPLPNGQCLSLCTPSGAIAPHSDSASEKTIKCFTEAMEQLGESRLCKKGQPKQTFDFPCKDRHLLSTNLSRNEQHALKDLIEATRFKRNADGSLCPPRIVICNADKNLGLTIVDYEWFHNECTRQLGNTKHYRKFASEKNALELINAGLQHLRRLVFAGRAVNSPAEAVVEPDKLSPVQKYLLSNLPSNPKHRVPSFYVIPKIHKATLVGRPITPAHRYFLSPACKLITSALHPIASLVPEILRDSTQLLLELESPDNIVVNPDEEIYLVTGDVESLYTNIPLNLCIELLQQLPIPTVVIDLLKIVFKHCVVRFDKDWYQQIDGFPMGIEPAPDVANLFMWLLLRRAGSPPRQRRLYRRFIDDLFMIWIGSRRDLDTYLASINSLHPSIKITWTVDSRFADFLDLHIFIGPRTLTPGDQRLDVRVHQKALNRYLYIPPLSFHRTIQHKAWIKAELLRLLRNSSNRYDYRAIRRIFFARLIARGFRVAFLRKVFSDKFTTFENRDSLLSSAQRKQDTAFSNAIQVLDKLASTPASPIVSTLHREWDNHCNACKNSERSMACTPFATAEDHLLRRDLVQAARPCTLDQLHSIFHKRRPPLVFVLPLTSATAGLSWRYPTLTRPSTPAGQAVPPAHQHLASARMVFRRPPSLGLLLRFSNPMHGAISTSSIRPPPPPPPPPQKANARRSPASGNGSFMQSSSEQRNTSSQTTPAVIARR